MIDFLRTLLSPIIWLMGDILDMYSGIVGSVGFSIILLSATFTVVQHPLRRLAARTEKRVGDLAAKASLEVNRAKETLKGESLFNETEKIYERIGYHPIQNMLLGSSVFVTLPFLVSAMLILTQNDRFSGHSFYFIEDLSTPDGLILGLNGLPIIMTILSIIESNIIFLNQTSLRRRFYIISTVLFILVYNAPAALLLYWTTSNASSLLISSAVGLKSHLSKR